MVSHMCCHMHGRYFNIHPRLLTFKSPNEPEKSRCSPIWLLVKSQQTTDMLTRRIDYYSDGTACRLQNNLGMVMGWKAL